MVVNGEQKIVVKFARSYDDDVHHLLADARPAPELLLCQRIAGGWCAVVMKKVMGSLLQCAADWNGEWVVYIYTCTLYMARHPSGGYEILKSWVPRIHQHTSYHIHGHFHSYTRTFS